MQPTLDMPSAAAACAAFEPSAHVAISQAPSIGGADTADLPNEISRGADSSSSGWSTRVAPK